MFYFSPPPPGSYVRELSEQDAGEEVFLHKHPRATASSHRPTTLSSLMTPSSGLKSSDASSSNSNITSRARLNTMSPLVDPHATNLPSVQLVQQRTPHGSVWYISTLGSRT